MFNLNPLTVLGVRSLTWMPPHFSKIKVATNVWSAEVQIKDWIEQKLTGRYSIVSAPGTESSTGKLKVLTYVGFEDDKELTYFMLACPHIRS
ncbi:hypothetical protein EBU71_06120 [bacterium]|nr:hypothetical protein [Candidatus Elulimicrobium humile]